MEGSKQAYGHFLIANPDGYHVVEDMVAEGDKVVTRLSARGTQTSELFGIPPTGKQVSMTGIAIYRIVNGKIVEYWSEIDNLGMSSNWVWLHHPSPHHQMRLATRVKKNHWVPENISHRKPAAVVAFVLALALTVSAFFVLVTRKNSGKTYAT